MQLQSAVELLWDSCMGCVAMFRCCVVLCCVILCCVVLCLVVICCDLL